MASFERLCHRLLPASRCLQMHRAKLGVVECLQWWATGSDTAEFESTPALSEGTRDKRKREQSPGNAFPPRQPKLRLAFCNCKV
ncbi:hypothetical protein SKAU_G00079370 [Synaphobranchus kaupii]|uniref:Uncharacterized protein n=1 Tax=Synaphobranchus kaupii TaxID=118154 RepID=A0A9Q1J518_SYNKA|nr:hypothetical protein SKAU_G00079370 [Synaphobranchus kaupii]